MCTVECKHMCTYTLSNYTFLSHSVYNVSWSICRCVSWISPWPLHRIPVLPPILPSPDFPPLPSAVPDDSHCNPTNVTQGGAWWGLLQPRTPLLGPWIPHGRTGQMDVDMRRKCVGVCMCVLWAILSQEVDLFYSLFSLHVWNECCVV